MFQNLDIFKTAHAMAQHAGRRQAVVARNMANADTPGYKAQDIVAFQNLVGENRDSAALRATRAGHMNGTATVARAEVINGTPDDPDPNRNTVSLETEMLRAVDVQRQHQRALSIYKSSLSILRASLGR